jgi:uncharacterized protein (DUF1800 family)
MGGLYCLMAGQPVVAGVRGEKAGKQIQGQERVLHALNRFTFGPRPGEAVAVEMMGLRQWFERQLNPRSIDDSALDTRLAMFPAMKMPQAELMERYPTPQRLRQMIRTGEPLPADPVEHAIYANDIARYEAAKVKREAAQSMGVAADAAKMQEATLPGSDVQGAPDRDAVRVIQLPPEERMQRMVQMPPEEFLAFRKSLNPREVATVQEGLNPDQKELFVALQGGPRVVDSELLQARMIRDIYSERQLEAVMTDFWLNHFNVYLRKNQNEPYLLPAFERDVIRPNALGKFEDLLVATAKSPAMLVYLDNWQSIGPDSMAAMNAAKSAQRAKNPQVKEGLKDRGLNENYSRELMELHTIGVQCEVSADRPARKLDKACGKGYTQQDVIEVAKALTGWTIDRPDNGAAYHFDERRHEPGTKMVMGAKIREGGEAEGMQVLHRLATSPATAKLVSTQLAVRFVSDTPPPALVNRMAKAFVKSHGDIKTVLRTMFNSPEFWSPEVYRAKVKTPIEFVVSAARASGVEVTNAQPLVASLNRLGMPLYGMQTPNGYSWTADPWVNAGDLVNRMNFALVLSSNRVNGVATDWDELLGKSEPVVQGALATGSTSSSVGVKEQKLEMLLLGQPVSDRTRATVLGQFQNAAVQDDAAKGFSITANWREPRARVLNARASAGQGRPGGDRESEVMAGLLLGSPEFQRR